MLILPFVILFRALSTTRKCCEKLPDVAMRMSSDLFLHFQAHADPKVILVFAAKRVALDHLIS